MDIEKLLRDNGPLTTSAIKKILVESGISDDAARKRISRTTGAIKRFNKIKFPKNVQLLYLEKHLKASANFRQAILDALVETDSIHAHALQSLRAFGARTTLQNFRVLSGCPTNRKKKKEFSSLVKELEDAKLIYRFVQNNEDYVGVVQPEALSVKSIGNPLIIQSIHELLFNPIEDWLRKNSLVSYNKIERFGNFAGYYWHLTAPSYLLPLIKRQIGSVAPGFLVADILPQDDIRVEHIIYFIAKCSGCSYQKNVRSFLPVLIGNSFSPAALKHAKQNNVFVTTPRNLFGNDVADAIDSLIRILKDTASFLKNADEQAVLDIITKIAKIEGKVNNVRGQLFELVSGHIIYNQGYSNVELGLQIQDRDNKCAEIDVFAKKNKAEIKIVECKGFSSKSLIDVADIEKWFAKIRIIRNWANTHPDHSSAYMLFEYWASSGFTNAALAMLSTRKAGINKFSIDWYSGDGVIKLAHSLKLTSMVKLLREHYVKDVVY
ncbi:MAG TPA: hypothetical protein DCG57_09880 [Candidatus Riflebacteria bacterium]|jgi:hypothetical protein|nr:hypothetical protein [Candidatus Riflebacteria bacterium]